MGIAAAAIMATVGGLAPAAQAQGTNTLTFKIEVSGTPVTSVTEGSGSGNGNVTVTVSAEASADVTAEVFIALSVLDSLDPSTNLLSNTSLTIPSGSSTTTGSGATFEVANDDVFTANRSISISGTTTSGATGVSGPAAVTLAIVEDEPYVQVTLASDTIAESGDGNSTTATASLMKMVSGTPTAVTTTSYADDVGTSGFDADDTFTATVSAGGGASTSVATLTFGATALSHTFTVTATDNAVYAGDETFTVSVDPDLFDHDGETSTDDAEGVGAGTASLTITDDEPMLTLKLDPPSINKNGGTTVTASLPSDKPAAQAFDVTVSLTGDNAGLAAVSENATLSFAKGATGSTGYVTITAGDTGTGTVTVSGAPDFEGVGAATATLTIVDVTSLPPEHPEDALMGGASVAVSPPSITAAAGQQITISANPQTVFGDDLPSDLEGVTYTWTTDGQGTFPEGDTGAVVTFAAPSSGSGTITVTVVQHNSPILNDKNEVVEATKDKSVVTTATGSASYTVSGQAPVARAGQHPGSRGRGAGDRLWLTCRDARHADGRSVAHVAERYDRQGAAWRYQQHVGRRDHHGSGPVGHRDTGLRGRKPRSRGAVHRRRGQRDGGLPHAEAGDRLPAVHERRHREFVHRLPRRARCAAA